MNIFSDPKKVYKIAAIVLLCAAVLVTAYFVYLGKTKKSDPGLQYQVQPKPQSNQGDNSAIIDQGYKLIISKIDIAAPIIMDVDGNNKEEYDKSLEDGVAQLKGSALPGKAGNVFVFGHSSYFADKPGNYKEVFAKLNDLISGDIVEIQGSSARYVYRIVNKKVVDPTDVSVAAQNNALKELTLMTCWPIGTTDQRLVVVGELVEQ